MFGPRRLLGRLVRAGVVAGVLALVRDRLIARNGAKYGFEPLHRGRPR